MLAPECQIFTTACSFSIGPSLPEHVSFYWNQAQSKRREKERAVVEGQAAGFLCTRVCNRGIAQGFEKEGCMEAELVILGPKGTDWSPLPPGYALP